MYEREEKHKHLCFDCQLLCSILEIKFLNCIAKEQVSLLSKNSLPPHHPCHSKAEVIPNQLRSSQRNFAITLQIDLSIAHLPDKLLILLLLFLASGFLLTSNKESGVAAVVEAS